MISSRTLLLFLIALNLLALAWWTGSMEPLVGSAREPGRLKSQIEPDSLRVTRVLADSGPARSPVPAAVARQGSNEAAAAPAGVAAGGASPSPAVASRQGSADDTSTTAGGGALAALPAIPGALSGQVAQALNGGGSQNPDRNVNNTAAGPYRQAAESTPDDVASLSPMIAARQDVLPPWRSGRGAADTNPFRLPSDGGEIAIPPVSDPMVPVAGPTDPQTPASGFSTKSGDPATASPPDASWQSKSEMPVSGLPLVAAALTEAAGSVDASEPPTCMAFQSLSYIEAREIEDELAPYGVVTELSRIDKGDFLVYIEPLSSIQLARRKYDQLKRLGVRDLHVVRAGYYRNGISLGMLRNFELASRHKEQMSDLGVTTMRIGPVNARGSRYRLITRGSAETMDEVVLGHEVLSTLDLEPCPN